VQQQQLGGNNRAATYRGSDIPGQRHTGAATQQADCADNIMFAIDYPYQNTEGAVQFMNDAAISDADKRKIFHQNAERIFGVDAGGKAAS
jgi:predicted TIM-barrel fold metal-dependent hydrolase